MPPKFLYFDLGKVLVDFSLDRMYRQMAAAAGVSPEAVQAALFSAGLQAQYETGQISDRQFHELFCRQTGGRADLEALRQAANDIFTLNVPIVPLVAQLAAAGHRLGILSNTSSAHWEHCLGRYRLVGGCFAVYALSFRLGACKPAAAIFQAAAELAGCGPEEIFYVDDIPGHVAGAQAAGFDAVQFTSVPELAAELRRRGIEFNY